MIYYTRQTTKMSLHKPANNSVKFYFSLIALLAIMFFNITSAAQDVTPPVLRNPSIGCSSLNMADQNECITQANNFNANTLVSAVAALYMDSGGPVTATLINTTPGPFQVSCSWSFTYTFKISDPSNNFVTCDVNRNGADFTVPTFTMPPDIILYVDINCFVNTLPTGPAGDVMNEMDNCTTGMQMQAVYEDAIVRAATCGSYTIHRTWHLFDSCGNAAADQVQTITVLDTIKPVFTVFPDNFVTTRCDDITYDAEATDNCSGLADLTYTFTGATTGSGSGSGSGSFFLPGITTITVRAADACGNSRTQSFTITKTNTDPPVPDFLGDLAKYYMVFTNGSVDANWQGATKGFIGDIAVNGIVADERTSGSVPYAGKLYTNANTLNGWQNIVNSNSSQATRFLNETSRLTGLQNDLENAFIQINALPVTSGFSNRSATSLNNLNKQNGQQDITVINVTSGFQVTTKINITGDSYDLFILRWDTDANFSNGYDGQVKFQSGGAIVPKGGLTAANIINVAGDINSSGGGSNPPAPYPQGPRINNGTGSLISGGSNFNGGGFFTGYWLTTGAPTIFPSGLQPYGQTAPQSNGIFVGAWYSKTTKFSMTSGTSGAYVGSTCALQSRPGDDADKNPVTDRSGTFTVSAMPNPSNSDFMLHITGSSSDPTLVRVFDISGKVISVIKLNGGISYTRFGSNLNGGTYFAEVIKGNNRQVMKLVKLK
jgi:hypothetical protein